MKYQEVINAKDRVWKSEARSLMESGTKFVIVHLAAIDIRDCIALAQEFDYTCIHEDEPARQFYPMIQPKKLGFVHRSATKRKTK